MKNGNLHTDFTGGTRPKYLKTFFKMKLTRFLYITTVLVLFSVSAFAQTIDGSTGITTTSGAPTWSRTAQTDARLSFDKTSNSIFFNDELDGTWESLPYASSALASGSILVGGAGGTATAVTMSGAVAIDNTGATTLTASAILDQANGLDLSISSGAIQVAYDFTEGTPLGATPAAGDLLYIYDLSATTHVPIAYSDLVGAAATLYTSDGTITSATRTVTFTDGTTTDLIFTDGTNTLLTLTDAGTTGTLAATGNVTVGLDLTVTGNDIVFGNAETISNATDGTILLTAPTTALSADLTVAGNTTLGDAAADVIILNGSRISLANVPSYANYAAATTGGAVSNDLWKCSSTNSLGMPEGTLIVQP